MVSSSSGRVDYHLHEFCNLVAREIARVRNIRLDVGRVHKRDSLGSSAVADPGHDDISERSRDGGWRKPSTAPLRTAADKASGRDGPSPRRARRISPPSSATSHPCRGRRSAGCTMPPVRGTRPRPPGAIDRDGADRCLFQRSPRRVSRQGALVAVVHPFAGDKVNKGRVAGTPFPSARGGNFRRSMELLFHSDFIHRLLERGDSKGGCPDPFSITKGVPRISRKLSGGGLARSGTRTPEGRIPDSASCAATIYFSEKCRLAVVRQNAHFDVYLSNRGDS